MMAQFRDQLTENHVMRNGQSFTSDHTLENCHTLFMNIIGKLRINIAFDARRTAERFRTNVLGELLIADTSPEAKTLKLDEFTQSGAFRNRIRAVTAVYQDFHGLSSALAASSNILQSEEFDPAAIDNDFLALLGGMSVFNDFYTEIERLASKLKAEVTTATMFQQSVRQASDWLAEASNALETFETAA
ncbi:unnamed protein product [Somion occarium]|uniref:Uncharacterized protein n=1 Tax=Somion occarium TaxID=3059160 RepID=A0ABP1E9Z7_9APHY